MNGSLDHVAQVMRWNVGGQPNGNAGGAVDEKIRELGGKDDRLLHRIVVTGPHVDGALAQFRQESVGGGG
jgi:hypothetical protein